MNKLILSAAALTTISVSLVFPAQAERRNPVTELVVFGDSNVDMGLADAEEDSAFYLTDGFSAPYPNVDGRNTNGPVVVEYAAEALDVPLLNFAVSGATTGESNAISTLAPGLFPEIENTGVISQIAAYEEFLAGERAGRSTVYVYWAGSNDLLGLSIEQVPAAIGAAMENLEWSLTKLVDLGARQILVATRTVRADYYSEDNVNGVALNTAIRAKVQELDEQLRGNIQVFEAFDYISEMIRNPSDYGFTNTTELCFDDPQCSIDPGMAAEYMLWDAPHKTTRVHEILAEEMVEQVRNMRTR